MMTSINSTKALVVLLLSASMNHHIVVAAEQYGGFVVGPASSSSSSSSTPTPSNVAFETASANNNNRHQHRQLQNNNLPNPFAPNYLTQSCHNSQPAEPWQEYTTLPKTPSECCEAYFNWVEDGECVQGTMEWLFANPSKDTSDKGGEVTININKGPPSDSGGSAITTSCEMYRGDKTKCVNAAECVWKRRGCIMAENSESTTTTTTATLDSKNLSVMTNQGNVGDIGSSGNNSVNSNNNAADPCTILGYGECNSSPSCM